MAKPYDVDLDDTPYYNEACAECAIAADSHYSQSHKFVRSRIAAYGFAWWNGGLEEELHMKESKRLADEVNARISAYDSRQD